MKAANEDDICKDYRRQAILQFGLDPFLTEAGQNGNMTAEEVKNILDDTLLYWAHPMIGNIVHSQILTAG